MATFAKQIFNATSYSAIRPTYPRSLYDSIYQYHGQSPGARWTRAVDLGCGTGESTGSLPNIGHQQQMMCIFTYLCCFPGQATVELTAFQEVIGVDPSDSMLTKANEALSRFTLPNTIKYIKSEAEDLDFLETASVDLITAGIIKLSFSFHKIGCELILQ